MRFDNDTLKNRYQTCRSYLEKRCEALPGQIERKFKNVSCYHESSRCYGMSNYINVEIQNENGRDFALKNKNPCSACEFQAKQGISIWGIKLLFFSV